MRGQMKIRFSIRELGATDEWDSYEYEVPPSLKSAHIVMIGRGYAFSHDWSMDDSESKTEFFNSRTNQWQPLD